MSALLLVIAGLLVRGLMNAHTINRGLVTEGVVVSSIDLESAGYTTDRGVAFYGQLRDRLEQTPGVAAVNIVELVPLMLSNRVQRNGERDQRASSPRSQRRLWFTRMPCRPDTSSRLASRWSPDVISMPGTGGNDASRHHQRDTGAPSLAARESARQAPAREGRHGDIRSMAGGDRRRTRQQIRDCRRGSQSHSCISRSRRSTDRRPTSS